jgi:hypothetical protein
VLRSPFRIVQLKKTFQSKPLELISLTALTSWGCSWVYLKPFAIDKQIIRVASIEFDGVLFDHGREFSNLAVRMVDPGDFSEFMHA